MNTYKRHRFPPAIISYAVWLYFRFNLSHRDIEDLLAQRGIIVSYESIRLWCIKFGWDYARRLNRRHKGYGNTILQRRQRIPVSSEQRKRQRLRVDNFRRCLAGIGAAKMLIYLRKTV